jgi:F-type H+-transporting ATPase subunit c
MALASPIFAQTTGGGGGGTTNWNLPFAYIAMGIASGLCGIGQGKLGASCAEAFARNPGAGASIRLALFLGLALIESLALYTFVITFVAKG